MTAESRIKQEARGRLRDANWGKAVALTIALQIPGALFLLCNSLLFYVLGLNDMPRMAKQLQAWLFNNQSRVIYWMAGVLLLGLLIWAVSAPLRLGAARWFYRASQGEDASLDELFAFYTLKGWRRALALDASLFLRMLGWALLFLLPGILLLLFAVSFRQAAGTAALLSMAATILLIGGLAASAWKFLSYFAARTAAVKWENTPVNACIRTSMQAVKGRKASVFVLVLSFFGWALLTYFVLPILFVQPYFEMSRTTCSKWLLADGETEENDEVP